MTKAADNFLKDMRGIAQRVGVSKEAIEDPDMLACVLAYRLGLHEGRRSLREQTVERTILALHAVIGNLQESGRFPSFMGDYGKQWKEALEMLDQAHRLIVNENQEESVHSGKS